MLGYHGESSRSLSQRQSGVLASNVQVGLPKAPAKWTTEVSTLMIRSRFAMAAAVSAKSLKASPILWIGNSFGSVASSGVAGPFCKEKNWRPGVLNGEAK